MIKVICNDCGHTFMAAVILGEHTVCPECEGDSIYVAKGE